jgi:hypothetical protein
MTRSNDVLWSEILGELSLAMTSATFDTWVAGSDLLTYDRENGRMVIGVGSSYAVDWLQYRLYDVVQRTAVRVAGRKVELEFTLRPSVADEAENAPSETAVGSAPSEAEAGLSAEEPPFIGFQPYRSDFTQVPKQFFEVVMRREKPTVQAFILAVIDQTVGVITNYHTGERREWWEASRPEIGRAAGINSLTSVSRAARRARAGGYVIRRPGRANHKYRHRRLGEPVDSV